jgi:hypothetical protein
MPSNLSPTKALLSSPVGAGTTLSDFRRQIDRRSGHRPTRGPDWSHRKGKPPRRQGPQGENQDPWRSWRLGGSLRRRPEFVRVSRTRDTRAPPP